MPFLLKYWRYVTVVAAFAAVLIWWNADVKKAYEKGRVDMAAELSGRLKDAAVKQVKQAREAEQKAASALAERQIQLEKDKQNAEKTTAAMRAELDRLRRYADHQNRRRNLPAASATAAAPDGASDTHGWLLFGQCSEKYATMAETADHQAADLREWQAYGQTVKEQSEDE